MGGGRETAAEVRGDLGFCIRTPSRYPERPAEGLLTCMLPTARLVVLLPLLAALFFAAADCCS